MSLNIDEWRYGAIIFIEERELYYKVVEDYDDDYVEDYDYDDD